MSSEARVGTAAWTIPSEHKSAFPAEGSHLERYAERLNAVEINSSFYRDHQAKIYARWAASVPADFRFAVKLSKVFTHVHGLRHAGADLRANLAPILELGPRLGCLLVQLPPKLAFIAEQADRFFGDLRTAYAGAVALEPRHRTWATPAASDLLRRHGLSRVIADPEAVPGAAEQDFGGVRYYRLHGSPVTYESAYGPDRLEAYARGMEEARARGLVPWCILDNTKWGHATPDALTLADRLGVAGSRVHLDTYLKLRHPPRSEPRHIASQRD